MATGIGTSTRARLTAPAKPQLTGSSTTTAASARAIAASSSASGTVRRSHQPTARADQPPSPDFSRWTNWRTESPAFANGSIATTPATWSPSLSAVNNAVAELGVPVSVRGSFSGTAGAFQDALAGQPLLILAAMVTIYLVLGMLYESLVHPITILSTLPSAGVGALLALMVTGNDLGVIGIIGIILLIVAVQMVIVSRRTARLWNHTALPSLWVMFTMLLKALLLPSSMVTIIKSKFSLITRRSMQKAVDRSETLAPSLGQMECSP